MPSPQLCILFLLTHPLRHSDLEHLRQKEERKASEKHNLSSQSQAMMSLNLQLQSTVMKAQAKSIDLELRKLEGAQAADRLSYIQPYLPDAFFKTENEPISCLLLFKRLVFKSDLIIKHLDQNHPISEKIIADVAESLVTVCEVGIYACTRASQVDLIFIFCRCGKRLAG
jgi:dynactin 1